MFRARGSPGFHGGSPRRTPELTQRFGCLPGSGLPDAIVGSAGLSVDWRQGSRRLGVVHGRIRFRLISVQHAFCDNFRDGDLFNGFARRASSSDDHGPMRLLKSFHCVLCRTAALGGASWRYGPDWLRGRDGVRRRFHARQGHLRNRRVAAFLSRYCRLFYVREHVVRQWASPTASAVATLGNGYLSPWPSVLCCLSFCVLSRFQGLNPVLMPSGSQIASP